MFLASVFRACFRDNVFCSAISRKSNERDLFDPYDEAYLIALSREIPGEMLD